MEIEAHERRSVGLCTERVEGREDQAPRSDSLRVLENSLRWRTARLDGRLGMAALRKLWPNWEAGG